MIATETLFSSLVRLSAPLSWSARWSGRTAKKLASFAATESGSALDMFKAAELCEDPKQRRLFFKHALDEARHAQMFSRAAAQAGTVLGPKSYDLVRATRQNLYRSMGPVRFVAFVHLAEKRGEAHFSALQGHFKDDPQMSALFTEIAKDERFHVSYSGRLLQQWRQEGREKEVKAALLSIRLDRSWQAWRRAGRRIGDLLSRFIVGSLYVTLLPFFALLIKLLEPEKLGWKKRQTIRTLKDARRQF